MILFPVISDERDETMLEVTVSEANGVDNVEGMGRVARGAEKDESSDVFRKESETVFLNDVDGRLTR